jgi:NhaP-type Na+/H+ and K+/H+ antiporter
VQAYKINQDEMVLKFANRIPLNLDFYTMVISRNGKYLSDKDKQIILKGFDVPMTEEEREERRVQGLYKDFVSYEISERFIHPENVQSFELWLSYTYPRQLAREKEKATQVDISKLKEALEGKKTVKA